MKRFTRICIALLAVGSIGCSTFALSGCNMMEETGDIISDMVSDVASGFSEAASAVLPEATSSFFSDNSVISEASMDPFVVEQASASGDFRKGHLSGYAMMSFVEEFEENLKASLDGVQNLSIEWQEGWEGNGDYAPDEKDGTVLQDGQVPFTGCVLYDNQDGQENVYYVYMSYDPEKNTVSVIRVFDGRDGDVKILDAEDANSAIEEIMMLQ